MIMPFVQGPRMSNVQRNSSQLVGILSLYNFWYRNVTRKLACMPYWFGNKSWHKYKYICLRFYHGLGFNMIGSDLKAKQEKHIIHGHETNWVYFERNVWISLTNDNVCLQITDREGLQNVSFDTALETGKKLGNGKICEFLFCWVITNMKTNPEFWSES